MTKLHLLILITVLALALALPGLSSAQALPPHLFIGTATVDGVPAPGGTEIAALVDGNPAGMVSVDGAGKFFLIAAGPGRVVTFQIGDYPAAQSLPWEKGGATLLDLTANRPQPGLTPPHVFTGAATIDGDPAPDGVLVTAWAADAKAGECVVRDGRYFLMAFRPDVAAPITFVVDQIAADEAALWEQGGATSLDLTARSDTSPPAIALEPIGDNLVRVFKFDNATKTWAFYDPREEFAQANTLTEVTPGEVYWIKVTETTTVSINGRPVSLTCAQGYCWNQVVW